MERLSSRLGSQSVVRPQLVPDAQPESACEYRAWTASSPPTPDQEINADWQAALARTRPLRLLATPEPLRVLARVVVDHLWWGNRQFQIARAWGPERIETGWWREADIRRDYYRIETDHGDHLWIFRCLQTGGWFVHGAYE